MRASWRPKSPRSGSLGVPRAWLAAGIVTAGDAARHRRACRAGRAGGRATCGRLAACDCYQANISYSCCRTVCCAQRVRHASIMCVSLLTSSVAYCSRSPWACSDCRFDTVAVARTCHGVLALRSHTRISFPSVCQRIIGLAMAAYACMAACLTQRRHREACCCRMTRFVMRA